MNRRKFLYTACAAACAAAAAAVATPLLSRRRRSDASPSSTPNAPGADHYDVEKIVAALPERIPCDGCDSCMPCGYGVDIPGIFETFNRACDLGLIPRSAADMTSPAGIANARKFVDMACSHVGEPHLPMRCRACCHCLSECPKHITIINYLFAIDNFIFLTRELEATL